jgi:hypothetical protein
MNAEQILREQIAAANGGIIGFQHEGEQVVRWLAGGNAPEVKVTFKHLGSETAACCPQCNQEIGRFDGMYGPDTGRQIGEIRYAGAEHHCQ